MRCNTPHFPQRDFIRCHATGKGSRYHEVNIGSLNHQRQRQTMRRKPHAAASTGVGDKELEEEYIECVFA